MIIAELEREYYYSEYGEEYDEGDPDYYDDEYDEDSYNDRGKFRDKSGINTGLYLTPNKCTIKVMTLHFQLLIFQIPSVQAEETYLCLPKRLKEFLFQPPRVSNISNS